MVNRVIRKSFYITLILVGALLLSGNAFAEDDTTFSITVNPSLNLSVSKAISGFSVTPSKNGTYDSDSFNVISSTNNATGYTLIMSVDGTDLVSETINVNTGDPLTISTLTKTQDGISAEAFAASTDAGVLNHYGVSIAGANYNAMEVEKEIKKTTGNNSSSDTTAISLAAKLNLLTVPAVYSRTINFALTANPVDPVQPYPVDPCIANPDCNPESGVTLQRAYEIAYTNAHKGMYEETTPDSNTYQYIDSWNGGQYQGEGRDVRFLIQDMTPEICATATAINSQALVLDIRDQSSYYIVKAADGRCWMQDNLVLDLTNVNVKNAMYSNTDTNHNTNTNATNTQLGYLFNGGRVSGESTTDNLPTAGVANWTSNYSFSAPLINTASKDKTYLEDSVETIRDVKYGIYYNICAASAGSYCYGNGTNEGAPVDEPNTAIDVEYDICPSGWRIPTGYSRTQGVDSDRPDGGEYQALADAYHDISEDNTQYIRVRKVLRAPRSGYFMNGTEYYQGTHGFSWSSTYYDKSFMYEFVAVDIADTTEIRPQDHIHRAIGLSVRCIAK